MGSSATSSGQNLGQNLFVELEPGLVVLRVGVLQAEEPDLPRPDGLDDLVEDPPTACLKLCQGKDPCVQGKPNT